jgi:hypothetical protein
VAEYTQSHSSSRYRDTAGLLRVFLNFTATDKTPRRFGVKREVDCEPSMRKGAPGGGRSVF